MLSTTQCASTRCSSTSFLNESSMRRISVQLPKKHLVRASFHPFGRVAVLHAAPA
jgi:hypothetical protein